MVLDTVKQTLKIDKRFAKVYLWEALLLLTLVLSVLLYAGQMNKLSPLIDEATAPLMSGNILQSAITGPNAESAMQELKDKTILYTAILVVLALLIWPLFKMLAYAALCNRKSTKKTYLKFFISEICWTLLLVIVIYLLQLLMYKTLFYSLAESIATRIVLLIAIIISFLLLSYLTITFFINMMMHDKVKEALKAYYQKNIAGIGKFIVPMLHALLVFIAVNIVMRIISLLPQTISLIITAILAVWYLVWLKTYYRECMEKKPGRETKHKKKR